MTVEQHLLVVCVCLVSGLEAARTAIVISATEEWPRQPDTVSAGVEVLRLLFYVGLTVWASHAAWGW
jgi:hypothetical protein